MNTWEAIVPWYHFSVNECVWHWDEKKERLQECRVQSWNDKGVVQLQTKKDGKNIVSKKDKLYLNECGYASRRKR